jgi:deoxyribodipyrimidine photo-lyase
MRTLVWFRGKDLRLGDHAPLNSALKGGEAVLLFVIDPFFFAKERAQELPHRMQYLIESLTALDKNVAHLGGRLLLAAGKATDVVPKLAAQFRVDRVVAYRWTEPFGRVRDERVRQALGVPLELFEGETLVPPDDVRTQDGRPFSVYTPFSRVARRLLVDTPPLKAPTQLPPLPANVVHTNAQVPSLEELGIKHNPRLTPGGERAARDRLALFLRTAGARYHEDRDRMDLPGTSRLSQDLKFGTLSARSAWHAATKALEGKAQERFQAELLWRDFAHHLLFHRPQLLQEPNRPEFGRFPWEPDPKGWSAWTTGHTGYPVVDASARQLLRDGFVHNRARMISASFLAKHLRIDYRRGEAHYMKYLTDGDWAQNNAGWQWSAGCGCDAQPYFRIFNPVTQGEKFDPDGAYVREFVPELAELDAKYIHAPWSAPPLVLKGAGIQLGKTYPMPIVDHATSRDLFLKLAATHLGKKG